MKKKIRIISMLLILILILFIIVIIFNNKNIRVKEENKKDVQKNIKNDNIKPTIKLKGKEEMIIVKNSIYEEFGATALDNIDGDITKNINIKSDVNLKEVGDYKVKYEVKDSSNNKAIVSRKIKVIDVDNKDNDGISVLMYHYFYDDLNNESQKNNNYLAKSKFEEQLKYLKDNNYYFPSMKELNLYLEGNLDLPEKSVVITMDDGYENNYTIAYPLALKYKIPITMFVVTSWTNPKDKLQQEMINSGYVIMQSHTHDMHKSGCSNLGHGGIFQCIDYNDGINDLNTSKELLGNSDSVAYPFGDNNENSQKIVKDAGYLLAFTTEYGKIKPKMNKLSLPRIRINGSITLESFIKSL